MKIGKHRDAATGLIADAGRLTIGNGAGEKDSGGVRRGAWRADHDPALVLFKDGRVLDQPEPELADVECNRLVIVADDNGNPGLCGACLITIRSIGYTLLNDQMRAAHARFGLGRTA